MNLPPFWPIGEKLNPCKNFLFEDERNKKMHRQPCKNNQAVVVSGNR